MPIILWPHRNDNLVLLLSFLTFILTQYKFYEHLLKSLPSSSPPRSSLHSFGKTSTLVKSNFLFILCLHLHSEYNTTMLNDLIFNSWIWTSAGRLMLPDSHTIHFLRPVVSTGGICDPRGHLGMAGDTFGCHSWGGIHKTFYNAQVILYNRELSSPKCQ